MSEVAGKPLSKQRRWQCDEFSPDRSKMPMAMKTQAEKDAQCGVDIRVEDGPDGRVIVSPRRGRIVDTSSWEAIVVNPGGPNRKCHPASATKGDNGRMGLREVGNEGLTRRLLTGLIYLKKEHG